MIPKPTLIPIPFAKDGDKSIIPDVAASADTNYCSFTEGFPVITETPIEAGGLPPQRTDFNSILHLLSSNVAYQNAGGMFWFDPVFAAAVGGYHKGAVLLSNDSRYGVISLTDNNIHNFNTNGLGGKWAIIFNIDDVGGVPIGTVITYAGTGAIPDGYLDCNGAAISRTTYAKLFAAIGTRYGAGNGSTTFNLPDVRGLFPRFWSNGSDTHDPDGRTRNIGSVQGDLFKSHLHGVVDPKHTHSQNSHGHGQDAHTHEVVDEGHSHLFARALLSSPGQQATWGMVSSVWNTRTSKEKTGITLRSANPAIKSTTATNNYSATGITIQTTGGAETRPKNMVFRGLIKYK